MNRNEAFDKILKYLYNTPNDRINLSMSKNDLGIDDRNLIRSICDEMVKQDWAKSHDNNYIISLEYKGREMIKKHGSYSSFLHSEKKRINKINIEKAVKIILSVISIFGVIWGSVYTSLNYRKDNKIDSQQTEIELLNKTIDSLNNELKKKPVNVIDTIKN